MCPERAPKPIRTIEEKLRIIERLGADVCVLRRFDTAFARMEPEDFIDELSEKINVRVIVTGFNFTFGRNGRGDPELLRRTAAEKNFRALIVDRVTADGETVSSTRIRKLLENGETEKAEKLLGFNL